VLARVKSASFVAKRKRERESERKRIWSVISKKPDAVRLSNTNVARGTFSSERVRKINKPNEEGNSVEI
jgi:hypothetical protein